MGVLLGPRCVLHKAGHHHFAQINALRGQAGRQQGIGFVLCGHRYGQDAVAVCQSVDGRIIQRHDTAGGQHRTALGSQPGQQGLHGGQVLHHAQVQAGGQRVWGGGQQIAFHVHEGILVQDADALCGQ